MRPVRTLPRGGARNSAHRRSNYLSAHQCRVLVEAAERAINAGLPFNRFITILWEHGGIDRADNARATGAFVKRAADWMRRHGHRLAWAWVQEASRMNGAHVHILVHVPRALDPLFRTRPLHWAKSVLPGKYRAGTVQSQRIAGGRSPDLFPDLYRANLNRKLRYMLKAASPPVGAALGLSRYGEASTVTGKRLGVWQRPGGRTGQVS